MDENEDGIEEDREKIDVVGVEDAEMSSESELKKMGPTSL